MRMMTCSQDLIESYYSKVLVVFLHVIVPAKEIFYSNR